MKTINFTSTIGHVMTKNGYKAIQSKGSIQVPTYKVETVRCETTVSAELLKKWEKK